MLSSKFVYVSFLYRRVRKVRKLNGMRHKKKSYLRRVTTSLRDGLRSIVFFFRNQIYIVYSPLKEKI